MRRSVFCDFNTPDGKVRRLNGGNLGPQLYPGSEELLKEYYSLELPLVRLHDAPLGNRGMRLVDIQHIFGNWKADTDNPDNYYFDQTDEYLRLIAAGSSEIMYRLGTSIEHSLKHFYTAVPDDFDRWTDICLHIIRHYNEGWNNGFHLGIRYWEIWNEPDDHGVCIPSKMWAGTVQDYCRLYETAAKRIKQEFPSLKIGGPSATFLDEQASPRVEKDFLPVFLEYCREREVPLDFFSWHSYSGPRQPFAVLDEARRARDLLDRYGFHETELHLTEWRYLEKWDPFYNIMGKHPAGGVKAAAHLIYCLIAWQKSPLAMTCFYLIGHGSSSWSPWLYGRKQKLYYAFRAFAEMAHYENLVKCTADSEAIRLMAGRDARGKRAILLAVFLPEGESCGEVAVRLPDGMESAQWKVRLLDETHDLEEISWEREKNSLLLPDSDGEYRIYLIREEE